MRRLCIILAMASLTAAALGQDTYAVKRIFKQGETDRYNTVIKFEQNETEAVLVTTDVTREVKQDGSAVVATTIESCVLRARGTEMPFPGGSGKVILSTYDPSGKLIKQETLGGGSVGQLVTIARPSVHVEKPMKIGDAIRDEIKTGPDKSLKGTVTLTFVGVDPKSADLPEECLRYKIVSEMPVVGGAPNMKTKHEYTVRVSRATGKLVTAEGAMDGPLPNGGTMKITYKVNRVSPETPKQGS